MTFSFHRKIGIIWMKDVLFSIFPAFVVFLAHDCLHNSYRVTLFCLKSRCELGPSRQFDCILKIWWEKIGLEITDKIAPYRVFSNKLAKTCWKNIQLSKLLHYHDYSVQELHSSLWSDRTALHYIVENITVCERHKISVPQ